MIALLALSLVPVALGVIAPWLLRAPLPPARAAVLLTAFALTVSLSTGLLLCLAAYVGTVSLLPVLHPDDWSAVVLRDKLPIPEVLAMAAGLLAGVLLLRAGFHVVRVVLGARAARASAVRLRGTGTLAVIEADAVIAHVVPGRRHRVVVSTGLLRRLTGPQRRALLAHEEAHVRHHHHVYVQLARLAAVADPLLWPVARAVERAVERWADAEAVRAVGDPAVVAHALGVAALARSDRSLRTLGAAGGDVVERVRDLLEPPPHRTGIGLLAITVTCWLSAAVAVLHTYGLVELSERVG